MYFCSGSLLCGYDGGFRTLSAASPAQTEYPAAGGGGFKRNWPETAAGLKRHFGSFELRETQGDRTVLQLQDVQPAAQLNDEEQRAYAQ